MAWLAPLPGWLLEPVGNGGPRGMTAPHHTMRDRTRLKRRTSLFYIFLPFPSVDVHAALPWPASMPEFTYNLLIS